jgi:nicotinamide riboside kinase
MKIAVSGATSTGKSTLIRELMRHRQFLALVPSRIETDERAILDSMGCNDMDRMPFPKQREFQIKYLGEKIKSEQAADNYITEHSFVDVASYWIIRDSKTEPDSPQNEEFVQTCRAQAARYDLHIYLPHGVLPFKADGYRSRNFEMHTSIDRQIQTLLADWNLRCLKINTIDLAERAKQVIQAATSLTTTPASHPITHL